MSGSNDDYSHHASCKKLQTDPEQGPEQLFYALVLTHPHQRTFDVAVTDGINAWSGKGLKVTRPPGFTEEEAWRRARELLTDVNPLAKPAALAAVALPTGELQFSWRWEREVGQSGRHVMKLPAPSLTAAAAGGGGGLDQHQQQQQPPGVLLQQQPPHDTIRHILDTLVTSYSKMQSSLRVCSRSQSSLSSSLDVLRGQLDSQAAAHKDRERELYLKFTMLLNQKTRQLHKEHELVKQLAAEVERLKGEADHDTDDDAREAAYAADEAAAAAAADTDTDPDPDDNHPAAAAAAAGGGPAAAAAGGGGGLFDGMLIPPAAGAAGGLVGGAAPVGSSRGSRGPVGAVDRGVITPDSEGAAGEGGTIAGVAEAPPPRAAAAAAAAGGGGLGVSSMDIDLAATQLLPESELEEFITQRVNMQLQQQQQQQQQ